ncbi:MAG: hypothetical protein M3Q56_09545 [Bacteroidota bacterium]|nr:hypothetical protein [Bacteroidota bacterium]
MKLFSAKYFHHNARYFFIILFIIALEIKLVAQYDLICNYFSYPEKNLKYLKHKEGYCMTVLQSALNDFKKSHDIQEALLRFIPYDGYRKYSAKNNKYVHIINDILIKSNQKVNFYYFNCTIYNVSSIILNTNSNSRARAILLNNDNIFAHESIFENDYISVGILAHEIGWFSPQLIRQFLLG